MVNPINRQIIPFTFEDVNDLTELFDGHKYETNHLIKNVSDKLNGEDSIGKSYKMKDSSRKLFQFGNSNNEMVIETRNNKKYTIKLTGIYVHVFESHLGFLDFEWEYLVDDEYDYLEVSYFLNELKNSDNIIKIKSGKDSYRSIIFKDAIKEILNKCFVGVVGFDGKGMNFQDLKPISYEYVYVKDNDREKIINSLNKAKNGYKESYKASESENLISFDNSYWGASGNAIVNISSSTNDPVTNKFFETNFISSFKTNYLVLTLLVLNQRFTLLKRIGQASNLVLYKIKKDEKEIIKSIKEIDSMVYKSELYNVRDNFFVASYVEHINKFYLYLRSMLGISELEKELQIKIDSLRKVIEVYNNIVTMKREKRNVYNKLNEDYHRLFTLHIVLFFSQILAFLTSFTGTCEVIEKITNKDITPNNILFVIPVILSMGIFVGILAKLIFDGKELRKVKIKRDKAKVDLLNS